MKRLFRLSPEEKYKKKLEIYMKKEGDVVKVPTKDELDKKKSK